MCKVPEELIKRYGEKKIDEYINQIQEILTKKNNELQTEATKSMNARYIVVSVGNKIRILDTYAPIDWQLDICNAKDYFANKVIYQESIEKIFESNGELSFTTTKKQLSVFQTWFNSDKTLRYDGIKMLPTEPSGAYYNNGFQYYNTWNGWSIKGNNSKTCQKFLDFLYNDICDKQDARYNWMLDWFAQMIQFPSVKHPKILVIRGAQGTGKNTLFETLIHLMGQLYAVSISNKALTNNFNSVLYGKVFVVADEAIWSGDRSVWGILKNITGSDSIQIECKGKDTFTAQNYIHLMITTNENFAAPIEQGNRRYEVFTTSTQHQNDSAYFKSIHDELADGGYEALMYLLQNREITTDFFADVNNFDAVATEDCRMESLSSENPVAKWLVDCWYGDASVEANILHYTNGKENKDVKEISALVMFGHWKKWKEDTAEKKDLSFTSFGKRLSEIISSKRKATGMFYIVDSDKCKDKLEEVIGFKLHSIDKPDSKKDNNDDIEFENNHAISDVKYTISNIDSIPLKKEQKKLSVEEEEEECKRLEADLLKYLNIEPSVNHHAEASVY